MADTYLTLKPTGPGLDGIVQSLYGGSINFTKICVGNGVPADPEAVEEMVNPLLDIGITSITRGDKEVVLTGYVTTQAVESGFYANEIGVYAQDAEENEYLFAYSYNATEVDYYPDASSGRTQELTLTVVVAVGPAKNVTAILIEGDAYARKEDFDAHLDDRNNPHHVTKEQVNLGNVDNVAVQDMAPTFTQAATRENIVSGETLPILFGKIAKVIADLITHISARNNPHNVTLSQVGAAAASHNHSAADINSGTLGVARGGTGQTNLDNVTVGKAKQLNTARNLKVNLGSTSSTSFNGTADATGIGVNGTLGVGNGGTGVTSLDGTDYGTAKPRKIYAGTGAMAAGSTALTNGVIYLQYI